MTTENENVGMRYRFVFHSIFYSLLWQSEKDLNLKETFMKMNVDIKMMSAGWKRDSLVIAKGKTKQIPNTSDKTAIQSKSGITIILRQLRCFNH